MKKLLIDYRPDLWECLVDKTDKNICCNSTQRRDWLCSICKNTIKDVSVRNMHKRRKGCVCPSCNSSISYGEKVIYNILMQLNQEFEMHKTFSWSDNREYDFYMNDNCIIEVHGIQHYKYSFLNTKGRSLEEEIDNDIYKEKLAKANGVENYIIIDALESNIDYIKNSIEQSELCNVLKLSLIDWEQVSLCACSNLHMQVINMWNQGEKDLNVLSKQTKYSKNAIRNILKRYCNLLTYAYEDYYNKDILKKEIEVYKNGKLIATYTSTQELCNRSIEDFGIQFDYRNISAVCKGKEKSHKGFSFRYSGSDTDISQKNNNEHAVIQYDLLGNFIARYPRIIDAAISIGINPKTSHGIGDCCRGRQKTAYGFIWRYEDDNIKNQKKKSVSNIQSRIRVAQYDKNMQLIKIYDSITEAANSVKCQITQIANVCKGVYGYKTAGGYIWRYA